MKHVDAIPRTRATRGSVFTCGKAVKTRVLLAALMVSTSLSGVLTPRLSMAQSMVAERSFVIRPQPLSAALLEFANASGIDIFFDQNVIGTRHTEGLSGTFTMEAGLQRLLANTGLSWRSNGARNIMVFDPSNEAASAVSGDLPADGSTVLPTIVVSGKTGRASAETPYETAAPTAHISGENIERFRGSSPADIFRGTPGVMSGEARNGAGAVDVNIRGMQGMGRVKTTIDGAENSMQANQGYQGIANRTFVDPDLLAGVDITKGSDIVSGGVAGTVAMHTVDAADIVEDGKTFGLRVKGGFGSNTSSPEAGSVAGYTYKNTLMGVGTATASSDGMNRPAFLSPTQGSGSIVAAMRDEAVDLLAGYAYRKRGNYHAGSHGSYAQPVWTGGRGTTSGLYSDYVVNGGVANYRAGEEVLNTGLETKSWLAKGTVRFDGGHSLQLGYTGYRSEAGDIVGTKLNSLTAQAVQNEQTSGTHVDTGTLEYRWNPEDSDLINAKANLWVSRLKSMNSPTGSPESLGLPADYRIGSLTRAWGASIDNTSSFDADLGLFEVIYGLSYKNEDTSPLPYSNELQTFGRSRDASRNEAAAYTKASYKPWDWLTLNGGLRYSWFQTDDRSTSISNADLYNASNSERGFSPSLGVTVEPWRGIQFYVNYSNVMRMPSLFETSSGSSFTLIDDTIQSERSRNWEVGANFIRDGVFADDDRAMLKLGFFDWNVKNYISREYYYNEDTGASGLRMYNIASARFQGLELSTRYERNGFTAELAANYYTNVEFCPTADTCDNKSLHADYASNQVPPKYSVALTVSQEFLEDRLSVGARASYVGRRAIGHNDYWNATSSGFITQTKWSPYTLVDVFADYKINENYTASLRVENLFDRFYVDPLSLVSQPGPGRTFYASITAKF